MSLALAASPLAQILFLLQSSLTAAMRGMSAHALLCWIKREAKQNSKQRSVRGQADIGQVGVEHFFVNALSGFVSELNQCPDRALGFSL